jgi:apolipoprotein N-acyltransferase
MVFRASLLTRAAAWPRLCALALGLIAATGFQPMALWPLTLIAMAGLSALIAQTRGWREAVLLGWLFGVAHFTLANTWIATAFTYQANMPAALGWAAVPLLSLYLAVYPALACAGARAIGGRRLGWPFVFAFAGCWIMAEWLRSWVFTGFAWDPLGIVLLGGFTRPGLAALTPWLGTYALSGLVVLLAAAGALMVRDKRMVPLGIGTALIVAAMIWPAGAERAGTVHFTLVQPDIDQTVLNDPAYYNASFVKTAALTLPVLSDAAGGVEGPRDSQARLVLWPESGVQDFLEDGYPQAYYQAANVIPDPALTRYRIARVIGPQSTLLTGATELVIGRRGKDAGRAVGAHNAVTAIDGRGMIVGDYAKAHLVPYGEYLPLRWLLEPLGAARLVPGDLDFWPGPGPRTLNLGPLGKAGIQLCYEITFSGQVVDRAHRPDYIFNPSNDGWFGAFGPPQHLAQARLRAIEEGLPVLRATTTGISAVIDARGVVRRFIPQRVAGRLDGAIPPPLAPTPFARLGNILPLAWAAVLLAIAAIALRRRRA